MDENSCCDEPNTTMTDHAEIKRISAIAPLTNTTDSGKGSHVAIKTNKHITKPSKKLRNRNG
jgi:hypothetical protein